LGTYKKISYHIGSVDRQADTSTKFEIACVVLNRSHMLSTGVRMAGRLGIHEGGQGA